MSEFKLAGDQEGYSNAFGQYRRAYMKSHFGLVVLIFAILLYVLYFIVKRLRGIAHKIVRRLGY